ncbi:sigma factor [Actinopolymorpha pittospori]
MQTESPEEANALEQAANAFIELRPRLFGIAYRMLGSAAEAEDILQEVWVRWQNTDRATIENPSAFLALITTRLAINVAQSARARRESYIGPWLPEPIDTSIDPAVGAERGEDLELAFLLLLERLTPPSAPRTSCVRRSSTPIHR